MGIVRVVLGKEDVRVFVDVMVPWVLVLVGVYVTVIVSGLNIPTHAHVILFV